MRNTCSRASGFGLVEILVGSAVLSLILLSLSSLFQTTLRLSRSTETMVQGDYLLEEGVEIVKLFRDTGYAGTLRNMSTTTPKYFNWTGTNWATTTVNTFVGGKFERKFTVTDVKRNANQDIAATGTYDPNIKLVTVTVSWWTPNVGTTSRSIQTYVTNIFDN